MSGDGERAMRGRKLERYGVEISLRPRDWLRRLGYPFYWANHSHDFVLCARRVGDLNYDDEAGDFFVVRFKRGNEWLQESQHQWPKRIKHGETIERPLASVYSPSAGEVIAQFVSDAGQAPLYSYKARDSETPWLRIGALLFLALGTLIGFAVTKLAESVL